MFKGLGTAMITPFSQSGIDYASVERLIETQIESGVDALFVCGTTGEPPTMLPCEKDSLIAFCIDKIHGRIPCYVGTGANSTACAVENSVKAAETGADGLLVVTPYYNKCTQEGLFQHYRAVADAVALPIIAYNVPGRTGVNILPDTAARLAEIRNIEGIKEASGNVPQIMTLCRKLDGSGMRVFSGDDILALPIFAAGGAGLISVASNVIPAQMSALARAALGGDFATARKIQYKYADFFDALFYEVNPIPIKHAASLLGLCEDTPRLPLTPMSAPKAAQLESVMRACGILDWEDK